MTRLEEAKNEENSYINLCNSNNPDLHGDSIKWICLQSAPKQRLQGAGKSDGNLDTHSIAESIAERDIDACARARTSTYPDRNSLESQIALKRTTIENRRN